MAMFCSAVFLCVFALSVNSISSKTLRNALLLDAKVEYQRRPWLTVDVEKCSSETGSYNFKFNVHVWRDTHGVLLNFHKWPLLPVKLSDGTFYNMSTSDTLCGAIKEDFFDVFATGTIKKACKDGTNTLQKGNYTFEYNVDGADFIPIDGIGSAIYSYYLDHFGGPLLVMKFIVDTHILAIREYEKPQEQTSDLSFAQSEHTTEAGQTEMFNLEQSGSQLSDAAVPRQYPDHYFEVESNLL